MKKILYIIFIIVYFIFNLNFSFWAPTFSEIQWAATSSDFYNMNVSNMSSLKNNIFNLFYPSWEWWQIFINFRNIAVWLLLIQFIWVWYQIMYHSDNEWERIKAKKNLMYLGYWIILLFWATWLIWTWIWIDTNRWSELFLQSSWQWVFWNLQDNIFFKVLSFFKTAAFFLAIIMIIYYSFSMIRANDKEDQIKSARMWIMNVLIALILIKIIDYLFYIAQSGNFADQASALVLQINKVLWFIIWWLIFLSIIYAWATLLTSQWDEEKWKKARLIVKTVFIVWIVIALFLLIIQQLLTEVSFVWF